MKNSEISLPYFTPEKWVSQSGSQENYCCYSKQNGVCQDATAH